MRRKNLMLPAAALSSVAVAASLLAGLPASAITSPIEIPCSDVESVFARGSGQGIADPEESAFRSEVERRISPALTFNQYELGSNVIDGHQYPAASVGTDSWEGFWNSVGAGMGAGDSFDYGDSVNAGVAEMAAYVTQRAAACPEAVFVLGGYSQGAQTSGETYIEALPADVRSRIVYQALFGDPKLHLPEGEGVNPPACRGEEYSEWRYDVPNCDTDNGSLGARIPYMPAGMTSATGLWCANEDFVCGSSKNPFNGDGHFVYADAGGAISEAAIEIARRLQTVFPDRAADIDTAINDTGSGTAGLDVVFLIDSTGSMGWQIEEAKGFAADMASTIQKHRGRVALVEYKDAGDPFTARILSGFQEDTTEFNEQLATISAYGGGDTPEAALHALMTAFNGLEWRDGATKAAVLLTDVGYHDPDKVDGATLEEVAKRALEIDPVNVYPVVPSGYANFYASLAEATTGDVIVNSGDTEAALTEALTRINTRPVAQIAHPHYYAQPGQSITFDVSDSYSAESEIVSYEWDYNGDGVFEESSTEPIAAHSYAKVSEGVMQVRMTDSNGTASNISAFVHIGASPDDGRLPAPENVDANVVLTESGVSTVEVSWESNANDAYRWGVTVNGIPVGMTQGTARTATVTEIRRDADVKIGVVGFTEEGDMGLPGSIVVPAIDDGYAFSGFQKPVEAAPTVNEMNAGRAVPMKFSLGGDFGLDIMSEGYPASRQVQCDSGVPVSDVESTTEAGNSSLGYDPGSETYRYVWKTDRSWAGSCRVFELKLDDGNVHEALFKFRR